MRLSIKVDGEMVRKGLEDLTAEIPRVARQRMRTVMNRIVRIMQEYPPEPAHRTKTAYHAILGTIFTQTGRTGTYFRSWKIEEITNGYAVENTAARKGKTYAQYVGGNAYGYGQAWMHKGRWPLLRDVTEKELEALPKEIEDDIIMVARRKGL